MDNLEIRYKIQKYYAKAKTSNAEMKEMYMNKIKKYNDILNGDYEAEVQSGGKSEVTPKFWNIFLSERDNDENIKKSMLIFKELFINDNIPYGPGDEYKIDGTDIVLKANENGKLTYEYKIPTAPTTMVFRYYGNNRKILFRKQTEYDNEADYILCPLDWTDDLEYVYSAEKKWYIKTPVGSNGSKYIVCNESDVINARKKFATDLLPTKDEINSTKETDIQTVIKKKENLEKFITNYFDMLARFNIAEDVAFKSAVSDMTNTTNETNQHLIRIKQRIHDETKKLTDLTAVPTTIPDTDPIYQYLNNSKKEDCNFSNGTKFSDDDKTFKTIVMLLSFSVAKRNAYATKLLLTPIDEKYVKMYNKIKENCKQDNPNAWINGMFTDVNLNGINLTDNQKEIIGKYALDKNIINAYNTLTQPVASPTAGAAAGSAGDAAGSAV